MTGDALEKFTAEVNASLFLPELTFSSAKFRPAPAPELELADSFVVAGRRGIAFQLKERRRDQADTLERVEKWFRKEVMDKACGQLANSMSYLSGLPAIEVTNTRGHVFDIRRFRLDTHSGVALYASPFADRLRARFGPYRVSKRAGFVHLLHIDEYLLVCRTLGAPQELSEYFAFREDFLVRGSGATTATEARILAQFIVNSHQALPDEDVGRLIRNAQHDAESSDLSGFLHLLTRDEPPVGGGDHCGYYELLLYFSLLSRARLREVKARIPRYLEFARKGEEGLPARLYFDDLSLGVLLVAIPREFCPRRVELLNHFVRLAKYDRRVRQQIGIGFSHDGECVTLDAAMHVSDWVAEPALEEILSTRSPFGQPKATERFRYRNVL